MGKLKDKLTGKLRASLWRLLRNSNEETPMEGSFFSGDDENYLLDFRAGKFGMGGSMGAIPTPDWPDSTATTEPASPSMRTETRITTPIAPKQVLDQLGRVPSNYSLDGLAEKIKLLEMKRELISQRFSAAEMEALIECLRNRMQYTAIIPLSVAESVRATTFRDYYQRFDSTDERHIEELCKKHDLAFKSSDIFIPEFPADAVQIMHDYAKVTYALCSKKPRFMVIANAVEFRDADGKRDPILLAQSPFGFYYYILGAWDKEMILLSEL
jgi:hypothetical protein